MKPGITEPSVLDDGTTRLDMPALQALATAFSAQLRALDVRVFATLLDNSLAWVVADLGASLAGVVHVPLPLFFTAEQRQHALGSAGVDALLTEVPLAAAWPQTVQLPCELAGRPLMMVKIPPPPEPLEAGLPAGLPKGTVKITFTSGSTGSPKGVCLQAPALDQVAHALVQALAPLDIRRHLCALPLAVLLENIAGLRSALLQGATCLVVPLASVGLSGSSGFDVARFHAAVTGHAPDSLIMLPQMLRAWVAFLQHTGQRAPAGLKFVAVGGAAVGAPLLLAARALGIPAYEGYGLSEGASVQTLNLPGADRPGSAGRALPHARVRVAADGEIEVAGSLFSGYLAGSEQADVPNWWPTGDLGRIDAEGFVHLQGRKKNILITSFGRNVSPEWVETALGASGAVFQAVVAGEGQPSLSAVLWPLSPAVPDSVLQDAVDAANLTLPDYAQVRHWVRAVAAFDAASGMATANGRPQRAAVLARHADALRLHPSPLPHESTP